MAALIGALRVSLSAETAQFEAGMKRAQRTANQTRSSFERAFGGLGGIVKGGLAGIISGLSLGAVLQGTRAALDYAGSLGEVAQQLGVTARELQIFRFAVQQNGGTVEQADQALGKFAIAISKALSGSKQAAAAFGAMGVSLDDLRSKGKTELIGQIADNMKKAGGASSNAAAGVALFGRGFQKIVPVLDQGSAGFNELAAAADELGIVLSDEQIQSADKTADKLDALMTVLKAKIAGDVADNSKSILDFADALFDLVRAAEEARAALVRFQQNYSLPNLLGEGRGFGLNVPGRGAVTVDLPSGGPISPEMRAAAKRMGVKLADGRGSGAGSPAQFLGGGGRGGRRGGRAPRDTSLQDAFRFEEEQRRLDMDILQAKQDLATDYVARSAISIELLNLEKEAFEAELKFRVASKDLNQTQADILKAKNDAADAIKRQVIIEEREAQRLEDYNALDRFDLELQRERLESEAQLAETASERRDVELRLLALAYKQERVRLETIVAEEEAKDISQQNFRRLEEARRQLLNLGQTFGNDRQAVINSTRGPMEDWLAQLPTTAARAQEAMERLQVEAFEGLIDAALALSEGFDSAKDALLGTLKQFLLGVARMELQKLFGGAGGIASAIGNIRIPGMATGGSFLVRGFPGVDRNVMSIGGLPVARVSYGERVSISNDNDRGRMGRGGDTIVNVNGVRDFDSFRRNERQVARTTRRALGIT